MTLSTWQKILPNQTESLQRRERSVSATNGPEQVQQDLGLKRVVTV